MTQKFGTQNNSWHPSDKPRHRYGFLNFGTKGIYVIYPFKGFESESIYSLAEGGGGPTHRYQRLKNCFFFKFKNLNFFIQNLKFIYQNSKFFPRATPGTSAGCLCKDLTKMEWILHFSFFLATVIKVLAVCLYVKEKARTSITSICNQIIIDKNLNLSKL